MRVDNITTSDGVKIAYEKEGEVGPPLVLIHGMGLTGDGEGVGGLVSGLLNFGCYGSRRMERFKKIL